MFAFIHHRVQSNGELFSDVNPMDKLQCQIMAPIPSQSNPNKQRHWSFGKAMLFAVAGMSTGGLVSPNIDDFSMAFVACLSIVGVISYGMAIGAIADIFSDYELNRLISQKVKGRAGMLNCCVNSRARTSAGCIVQSRVHCNARTHARTHARTRVLLPRNTMQMCATLRNSSVCSVVATQQC